MRTLPARSTDPETSHEAVASEHALQLMYNRIVALYQEHGDLPDFKMVPLYQSIHGGSPSGIRSRRKELCDQSRVGFSGYYEFRDGSKRRHRVWGIL